MAVQGGGNRPRTQVGTTRVTGTIQDWKGKFGWIQPDKPIAHPQASMHKGQIYLSQSDVEAEISGVGAHVSFMVYADGTGLGASGCRPATSIPVQPTVAKPQTQFYRGATAAPTRPAQPKAGGAKPPPGPRQRVNNTICSGQIKLWKGGFGWIVPLEPIQHPLFRGQIYLKASDVVSGQALEAGTAVNFYLYSDAQGLGAEECTVADDQGWAAPAAPAAKAFAPKAQSRPEAMPVASGPRERLTIVPTTGEVVEWKGNFGWIRPHETVDHAAASKREGKVVIAKKDLVGEGQLQVGQLVQFHVFVDNSGVGAEECMPF